MLPMETSFVCPGQSCYVATSMNLRAADIMQTAVVTVSPDMPLAQLEDFLLSRRIGGAPVVEKGRLVGIVSRSDVVRSLSLGRSLAGLINEGAGPLETPAAGDDAPAAGRSLIDRLRGQTVRDAMVTDVVCVAPDAPVHDVARVLVERHLHRVVVTREAKLLGIITSLDLVRLLVESRSPSP